MRRSQRFIAATVLIALSGALAGCSTSNGFDPSDLLDFLDTKKKLPGDRRPVFPEGVPGLEQGVPRDLYRGASQEQPQDVGGAPPPSEQSKSKRTAKSKGKGPATVRVAPPNDAAPETAAPDAEAAPEEEGSTAAAPPAPKPKKIVRRRTTAPPADQPAQAARSAPQAAQSPPQPAQTTQTQQSAAPFPAPLPSGSFSR